MRRKRRRKGLEPRFGNLEPRYRFFLNPYEDLRYTRCPQCDAPTKARKHPFLVFVQPDGMAVLNMTARYCPACDLLILHQDRLEGLLAYTFEKGKPEIIGNDYLVLGTLEPSFWRRRETEGTLSTAKDHLHDFADLVTFEPARYAWVPDESKAKETPAARRPRDKRSSAGEDEEETS
jgi:hypothetical protein